MSEYNKTEISVIKDLLDSSYNFDENILFGKSKNSNFSTKLKESEISNILPFPVKSPKYQSKGQNFDYQIIKNDQPLKKEKYGKYIRDPNLPKRPITPYLRFSVKERINIHKKYPDLTYRETADKAAEIWKNMSFEEKEPYLLEYEKDMEEYNEKKEEYLSSNLSRDFELFKGNIKGETICRNCQNEKSKLKAKPRIIQYMNDRNENDNKKIKKKFWKEEYIEDFEYNENMDFDQQFWEGYREARDLIESKGLERLVKIIASRNGDEEKIAAQQGKDLGNSLAGFVKFVKKSILKEKFLE